MQRYVRCDKSTVKLRNKSSVPCLFPHAGEYQSSLLWHKWLEGILMTLLARVWRSSGKDLSKLGSGRLKRSVIKCPDANVGSILVALQHRLQLNYLNTPVCEKQGRWGVRRGEGGRRSQVTPHLTTFISRCRQISNVQSFALEKKKRREKGLLQWRHHINSDWWILDEPATSHMHEGS